MMSKPSILVVEDQPSLNERFKFILENPPDRVQRDTGVCGFQVDVASNGKEAEKLLECRSAEYEAVLLDMRLPKNDDELRRGQDNEEVGRQLLTKLQSESDIAVVVMTGYPSIDNLLHSVRHGATDFVIKPMTTREDEALLFVRLVKAVGRTREVRFESLRVEHERRIGAIERRRDRESFAQETSSRMSRISASIESIKQLLSRRFGLHSEQDADDPICRAMQVIKKVANEVHQAGWADSTADESLNYSVVNIADVLSGSLDRFRPCYGYHEVELRVRCAESLHTATFPDELRQVIDELLFGALQSVSNGSLVDVCSSRSAPPEDVVISVTRQGDAVPERLDLVARIVNNIGGRLEERSTVDGTCVTIRIPVVSHE